MTNIAHQIQVLHVDDEPDLAELASIYLEREDDRISVQTATTPDEGVDVLAANDIDCIVSDYDMPGLNGIEFLETVREEYLDLPFILYTGKGSEEIASDAISAGVTDYLQKEGGTSQYTVLANRITNAVERAHERMNALIDDLLSLAREGDHVSEMDAVDLGSVVRGCWETVATADATLHVESSRAILADRSRLQQLVENLMRNAIEHAGSDVTVSIGELADGFYVADDGPGIPPDVRDDVFEVGYSTSEHGTGFGLSIVKQIVDAHDWEIAVREGSDGGARFEITGVAFAAD